MVVTEKIVPHSQYLPQMATLVRAEQLTESEKLFEIKLPNGSALGHVPGQFVEVSVLGVGEAPISVSSSPTNNGSFDLVVRKAGSVTQILHELPDGAKIGIRGPYGTGFDMDALNGKDLLVIGGGIGLVPLRSVIQYAIAKRADYGKIIILYGAKNPEEMLFRKEIQEWEARDDIDFRITVDRGSDAWKGKVGVITTLIPSLELDLKKTEAIICGPPIMYKFVLLSLYGKQLRNQQITLSLERRMKCGLGKCGHCQMNHLYVCQSGPVFNYAQIQDLKEVL